MLVLTISVWPPFSSFPSLLSIYFLFWFIILIRDDRTSLSQLELFIVIIFCSLMHILHPHFLASHSSPLFLTCLLLPCHCVMLRSAVSPPCILYFDDIQLSSPSSFAFQGISSPIHLLFSSLLFSSLLFSSLLFYFLLSSLLSLFSSFGSYE